MVYLTAWLLVCTLLFVSLTLQYHGVEVRTVCGVVRAAHLGPNHGQRVAAPRSAALGTAADIAAGTVAQLLVVKPMAWRSLGSTRHAIPSRKRSHAAAPPR